VDGRARTTASSICAGSACASWPPKGFDGRGNYTLGIREQLIFPEIDLEKIDKVKGLNISIVTSARTDEEGRALLTALGMPFRKQSAAA